MSLLTHTLGTLARVQAAARRLIQIEGQSSWISTVQDLTLLKPLVTAVLAGVDGQSSQFPETVA